MSPFPILLRVTPWVPVREVRRVSQEQDRSRTGRWRRIKDLLATALELPPSEREDFLKKLCGDDQEIAAEVVAFIRAHDEAGDFLEGEERE